MKLPSWHPVHVESTGKFVKWRTVVLSLVTLCAISQVLLETEIIQVHDVSPRRLETTLSLFQQFLSLGTDDNVQVKPLKPQGFDLDAVFGDNMVLQHGSQVAVYGFLGPDCVGVELVVLQHNDDEETIHRAEKPKTTLVFRSTKTMINATVQPFGKGWGVRPCSKQGCGGKKLFPFNPWNEPLSTWKTPIPPQPPGGNYSIRATCILPSQQQQVQQQAATTTARLLSDDPKNAKYNMYPASPSIAITNVTFGDVWFCSGQSNMGLPLRFTFDRNETMNAILHDQKYHNIRIMAGYSSNPPYGAPSMHNKQNGGWNPGYGKVGGSNPWLSARDAVVRNDTTRDLSDSSPLLNFGATCWHFGQQLVDQMITRGNRNNKNKSQIKVMPMLPIGLINTAVGESKISWFMDNATVDTCHNRTKAGSSLRDEDRMAEGQLFATHVLPFADLTIRGWIWYQGEHNMAHLKGSSAANVGYGCEMKELISGWRKLWSRIPDTTAPDAPFGVVTLASSGSMGRLDVGMMRHAQTANYGVLPSADLPNAFLAQAYDLDDEWGPYAGLCFENSCCHVPKTKFNSDNQTCNSNAALREACHAPTGACSVAMATPSSRAELHPRNKKAVGDRLGVAAYNLVYGGTEAYTGPTLQGCSVLEQPHSGNGTTTTTTSKRILEVRFNTSLLRGDSVSVVPHPPPVRVQPNGRSKHRTRLVGGSQLYVQTKASRFCMEPQVVDRTKRARLQRYSCPWWAGGDLDPPVEPVRKDILDEGWIMLNFTMAPGSTSAIHVDLSPLPAFKQPTAIKYAWGFVDCCDHTDPDLYVKHGCIANCPIRTLGQGLPANPFQAKIVGGKCRCVTPQECNG